MHERLGFGPFYVFFVIGAAIWLFASGTVPANWITILAVPLAIGLTAGIHRCWRRATWRTPAEFAATIRKMENSRQRKAGINSAPSIADPHPDRDKGGGVSCWPKFTLL
jgi:hypothetical protein